MTAIPPCLIYEDEHLLVVNKPAGWNTHAPAPHAGEGIYDWLRHREPRWAKLAIIHRLDKETSGVLVFGKSTLANRALTGEFAARGVRKKYLLVTDRPVPKKPFVVESSLVRAGERYLSRPLHPGGERAETHFRLINTKADGRNLVEAAPVTGRTHQIRVQAAASGFPVLGDALYGGTAAPRVHLHAQEIIFQHPASRETVRFEAPVDFEVDPGIALRRAMIDTELTDAFRLIHGAADGSPGLYVDRLGDYLLAQTAAPVTRDQPGKLDGLREAFGLRGVYHKMLDRRVGRANPADASPLKISGETVPAHFVVRENGLRFELSFAEGYSVGLFLDQRDNRRRLLGNHIAAEFPLFSDGAAGREVLNTFAYTCGFSVCAARAGARVTSLDLSKKYLDWGRRNFVLNDLDPAAHDFIFGDVFDWLRRFGRKKRSFDVVVLDPPTFSRSKGQGAFKAEADYGGLVAAALPILRPQGVLLASTNAARLASEDFLEMIRMAVASAGRKILQQHYVPQPPDFPITRAEPAYLKTVWLRIS